MMLRTKGLLGALAAAGLVVAAAASEPGYEAEVLKWRAEREARLKADGGWLTVAGLYWLREGENRFGTGPGNEIALPPGSAPGLAGVFEHHGGKTVVRVEPGVSVTLDGRPVTKMELRDDVPGPPDVLTLGRLTLHVIERGGQYAIRLKDMASPLRRAFKGLRWFPVKESYRVTARFLPYDPPHRLVVPNILGQVEEMPSPGVAVFTLGRTELRLDGVLEEPGAKELFFIFRDLTSGKETYPAGRFLYADMPKSGQVVLDFNRAYSPPCAFTPYATCPLPPKQNELTVRVEAGELSEGHKEGGGH